jgi:hypothetical protein
MTTAIVWLFFVLFGWRTARRALGRNWRARLAPAMA